MTLQEWIDTKFMEIAKKLPNQVDDNPSSFSCGHTMGYKQALLDLDMWLEDNRENNDALEL